ncbi:hypothetical protein GDO86_018582 [Hymenochirus boettgeri]|uniref:Uncharacterized protein n=1 Tax=Hymenochirus boettgeri TaxID=247094 RepID=A0A8T2IDW6_9PIPI|nr:hypothetical protein GDO86_018582 [Hymenochirus boettgeri]
MFPSVRYIEEKKGAKRSELKKQPVGYSKQADFAHTVEEKVGTGSSKEFTKNKNLDSVLNIKLIEDKSEMILKRFGKVFSTKDTIYAVIPKQGYEFFVGQWSGSQLHFTALINTRLQKQGHVLMKSEIDNKFLNVQEAQCLANQVQLFMAVIKQKY